MSNKNSELIEKNPKKAIKELAIPILILNVIITMYNVVDGIWISGISEAAIVAVGTLIPSFSILTGISGGIGMGTTSAIGYYIGAKDRKNTILGVKNATFIFFILTVIMTIIFLVVLKPLLISYSLSGEAIREGLNYGIPLFGCSFTFIFSAGIFGMYRACGETKKPLYALGIGFILNALLDPVFIYVFNLGVLGAAISSVLTSLLGVIILGYWLFIKKTIYPDYDDYKFKFDTHIIKRILDVGIPSAIEIFLIVVAASILIYFTQLAGDDQAVAIHTLGYRLYQILLIPISSLCATLVIVVSNSFGAKNFNNIKKSFKYVCKITFCFGLVNMLIVLVFAPQLSLVYLFTTGSAGLIPKISLFLRIIIFQGLSKGFYSFIWTFTREFVLVLFFTYFLGFIMNWGLIGIWIGIFVGKSSSTIFCYLYANYYINNKLNEELSEED
ncbi:MATE family efflux transporter [uncultured Methanobrevibacter sp.]|uniref:MATE family efflux transporter n=1 Tax=uncultured Methanobrevibacter sp. TaxID=253161 RepID=UPI0025CFDD03|nr:MATE family efflux transporter [uncultured Methanobrevibacter sp.]